MTMEQGQVEDTQRHTLIPHSTAGTVGDIGSQHGAMQHRQALDTQRPTCLSCHVVERSRRHQKPTNHHTMQCRQAE